jgi:hypothetical protein
VTSVLANNQDAGKASKELTEHSIQKDKKAQHAQSKLPEHLPTLRKRKKLPGTSPKLNSRCPAEHRQTSSTSQPHHRTCCW